MNKLLNVIFGLVFVVVFSIPVMAQEATVNNEMEAAAVMQNSFNTPSETKTKVDAGDSYRSIPNGHETNYVHRDSFYGEGPQNSPYVQSVDLILEHRPLVYTRGMLKYLEGDAADNIEHVISSYFGEFRLTSEKYVMFLTKEKMQEVLSKSFVIKIVSDSVNIKGKPVNTEQALYCMVRKMQEYGANAFRIGGQYASMKHKSEGSGWGIGFTGGAIGAEDGKAGGSFTLGYSKSTGMAEKLKYPGLYVIGYYVQNLENFIDDNQLEKVKRYQKFLKKVEKMRKDPFSKRVSQ
jgi:hypothetical protein